MWQTCKHLLILSVLVAGAFMPIVWIALILIYQSADNKNKVISKTPHIRVESLISHSSYKAREIDK